MNNPPRSVWTSRTIFASAFTFLITCSIIGSSYVGLNGHHVHRQADAYAQILGFLHLNDLQPLDDFYGVTALYDIPIYQFVVALIAGIANVDPLITTKYFDLLLFFLLALALYKMAESFQKHSSYIALFLLGTSPLFLHYYSAPLPDTMATSFSAYAILLLMAQRLTTFNKLVALALICISTLIKSPIPFVFLAFFTAYVLAYRAEQLKTHKVFFIILFGTAAALAVSSELVRSIVLVKDGGAHFFAQTPRWYFGDAQLRTSPEFWRAMIARSVGAIVSKEIAYALALLAVLHLLISKRAAWKFFAVCSAGFLSGWLVFSNVYFVHDYYEIPVTVILFFYLSVSATTVLTTTARKWKIDKWIFTRQTAFIGVAIMALAIIYGTKYSAYSSESIYATARYMLRDVDLFLLVDDPPGPTWGGYTKTKLRQVNHEQFERSCDDYLSEFTAIISVGDSPCLRKHKSSSSTFIDDGQVIIYLNNTSNLYNLDHEISGDNRIIIDKFNVYHEGHQLTYRREKCTPADIQAPFFLHLPNSDVINHDFTFSSASGTIEDGECTVTVDIGSYSGHIITGQYVVTSNGQLSRTWEAGAIVHTR